ncbi:LuxR family transcriptional regulator [Streptomyces sp. GESEQ-35]|uniref:helix-turn-helix transcriptional regulator n=1 Tax=Streptomyces sp. GESEQ-35 TaxID=2812657 RepID=UPI001B318BFC|nr:LuxR family transcriptional regulator [Streptomyces sp. GESEQ-35]
MRFIERDAEVRTLAEVFVDSERCSRNPVVLIEGPVGCGKSQLLHLGVEQATCCGALVLEASGAYEERRLSFGIMRQLMEDVDIPDEAGGRLRELVDAATEYATSGPEEFHVDDVRWPQLMHSVFLSLGELAKTRPVVIAVDDLHHVDEVSLHFLKYLVRRSRGSRLSFLLTIPLHQKPQDSLFEAELLRQPAFTRLSLGRLSRAGVQRLVGDQPGAAASSRAVDELCMLSGGNPLLVRAAVEECRRERTAARIDSPLRLRRGGPFTQAVQACLVVSGPEVADTAAAFAVLGPSVSVSRIGRLLGIDRHTAEQGVAGLRAAGLVTGTSFRHPAIERAVREGFVAERLAALHGRAAELLRDEGEAVPVVADHLVACGGDGTAWGLQALVEAAESALGVDRAEKAVSYLEAALEMCDDDARRAEIQVRLAEVVHRVDPSTAEPLLDQALSTARRYELSALCLESLARMVRARGYVAESTFTVRRLSEAVTRGEAGPKDVREPSVVDRTHGSLWRPGPLRGSRPTIALDEAERELWVSLAHGAAEPALLATTVLWTLPGWGTGDGPATRVAGSSLSARSHISDMRLPGMLNVVKAFAFADRTDAAARWCETLSDEAGWRRAPGWRAAVSAVHAEVLLLQGRFAEADEKAAEALADVPIGTDSAVVAGPVACRILAATATGRYEDAARHLGRRLPERVHHTVDGLGYLRARGRYLLAIGHAQAALDDFLRIGRRTVAWDIDKPGLIPWRIDAAEAWLRLGENNEAERLITEQASGVEVSNALTRGMTLRLRASTAEPPMQRRLLTRAVGELQKSGSVYELARALADLGQAHRSTGDRSLSESVLQRASRLAEECGAEELSEQLRGPSVCFEGEGDAESKLSESERRVAALAAFGHTNREIAAQLHVTVSTVEQHLTRVYRKLNIARRQDLPPQLRMPVNQVA